MSIILRHIENIVNGYKAPEPLHLFLKNYYSANRQLGSRDRKAINEAVYGYFRLKMFLPYASLFEIIQYGLDRGIIQNTFLTRFIPPHNHDSCEWCWPDSFPPISDGLNPQLYWMSLLYQPRLFIRLLDQQYLPVLIDEFPDAEISYLDGLELPVLNLPNGAKLEQYLPPHAYVVQDFSSQKTLCIAAGMIDAPDYIRDVCSGAGGKTILAKTIWPKAKVLATDIRPQILKNLVERLCLYNIDDVQTLVWDSNKEALSSEPDNLQQFDLVICDVPCSGSGTWARTPEQIHIPDEAELDSIQQVQLNIVQNSLKNLKSGSYLVYITCSVFKKENEDVIETLTKNVKSLKLVHQQLISGIEQGADSMFVAILKLDE